MKNLVKIVGIFLALGAPAFAQNTSEKPDGCASIQKILYETFVGTRVEGRIVKIKIKKYKGQDTAVFIVWHPRNEDYIMEDTISIIESVSKTIPDFSFVYLKAIHPGYMRWSKYVLWEAKITKNAFSNLRKHQNNN